MASSSPPPPATAHASLYQVVYDTGSDSINSAGQRAIEDVSNVVDGSKTALVTIVGRSDATGGADYNMQLSKKRAEAVRDALIATGKIDPTHINTAWTGRNGRMSAPTTVSRHPATAWWIFTSADATPRSDRRRIRHRRRSLGYDCRHKKIF